jgi:hypothetical protein
MIDTIGRAEEKLKTYGEYNFGKEDDQFGAPYGVELLRKIFPTVQQAKGMSVYSTPIGKVVVTWRRIVRI